VFASFLLILGSLVFAASDTQPPVIAMQADLTVEATGYRGATVTGFAPATMDDVDGPGMATCTPAPGTVFPLGATKVKCAATDAAGNVADSVSFTVTVIDTTPPTIRAPADVTFVTNGSFAYVPLGYPFVTDLADGSPKVKHDAPGKFFIGTTTRVTWTATDRSGNAATSAQLITVVAASSTPTPSPTPAATASPSPSPTPSVTPSPSPTVAPQPTATPTPVVATPSVIPSTSPTPTAIPRPSPLPSPTPSALPDFVPTVEPLGSDTLDELNAELDDLFSDFPEVDFPAGDVSDSESTMNSSVIVSGSFGGSASEFVLTYEAPAAGLDGELAYALPLDFSDYQAGLIGIEPEPKRVQPGSVNAVWDVRLDPGQAFQVTVRVAKKMDSSVLALFSLPDVQGRAPRDAGASAATSDVPPSDESNSTPNSAGPATGLATATTPARIDPVLIVVLFIATAGFVLYARYWAMD